VVTPWVDAGDLAIAGMVGLGLGVGLVLSTALWRWVRNPGPGGDDEKPGRPRHL
jgi:hypothetical protein